MSKSQSTGMYIVRLTLVLFLITAIVALLLGAVNGVTADRIAAIQLEKTNAAMAEVLPAGSYTPVETFTDETGLVKAVHAADVGGYVVEVTPTGFGGTIDMVVGVDAEGAVTGVSIIDMSETSGLGDNAKKAEFRDQFVGGTGDFAVTKDGGTIDALTGATITSRAVANGVNAAVACAQSLG